MTTEQKEQIREAIETYMSEHGMTQQDFIHYVGVSAPYIVAIRNGSHAINKTIISDKWYTTIADKIGYSYNKEYWRPRQTEQLERMIPTLEDAKEFGYTRIIVGETGSGKTYVSELFARKYPNEFFSIKIGASDNLSDILDKIIIVLGINSVVKGKSAKIRAIIKRLQELRMSGLKPMLHLDECEYMKLATICTVKEFYDYLFKTCAIILTGTPQFIEMLESLVKRDKIGIKQFYRRVKFGIVELPPVDRKFKQFFTEDINKELQKFLCSKCDNYGELHDALVPSMREADRLEKPLTVDLVKNVLSLQYY